MRPQIISGRVYMPIPAEAGQLKADDKFKIREKGALYQLTHIDNFGWLVARKVFGDATIRLTTNFPVIHYF